MAVGGVGGVDARFWPQRDRVRDTAAVGGGMIAGRGGILATAGGGVGVRNGGGILATVAVRCVLEVEAGF